MMTTKENWVSESEKEIHPKVKIEFGNPNENSSVIEKLETLLPIVKIVPCSICNGEEYNYIFSFQYWLELIETISILDLLESFPKSSFYVITEEEQKENQQVEGRIFYVSSLEEVAKLLE